jgi:plasmid stability protein
MFESPAAFDPSPDEPAPSSRRYMVVHLDEPEKATLKAQARRHGRTQEEEASEILAAELRRLADDDELSRLEAEFHAKSAKLAFVFAVVVAVGIVLVLAARGLL